jgi:hypothetical protein
MDIVTIADTHTTINVHSKTTTHCKIASEPSHSGIAPVSWLLDTSSLLQSQSQTLTASPTASTECLQPPSPLTASQSASGATPG